MNLYHRKLQLLNLTILFTFSVIFSYFCYLIMPGGNYGLGPYVLIAAILNTAYFFAALAFFVRHVAPNKWIRFACKLNIVPGILTVLFLMLLFLPINLDIAGDKTYLVLFTLLVAVVILTVFLSFIAFLMGLLRRRS